MRWTPTRRRRDARFDAFTLVELLVVIAIIGVLVATLLPELAKSKAMAQCVACLSNERQIGVSVGAYVSESKEWWPVSAYPQCGHSYHDSALWAAVVAHYGNNPYVTEWPTNSVCFPKDAIFTSYSDPLKSHQGILKCPTEHTTNAWGGMTSVSYGWNAHAYGLGYNDTYGSMEDCTATYGAVASIYFKAFGRVRTPQIINSSTTIMVADENQQGGYEYSHGHLTYGTSSLNYYHPGNKANILWTDGHATSRSAAELTDNDFWRFDPSLTPP